ncbi:MAG: S9 family peptidase [Gluconacetobacter diazotrophicus]|nr:S9 family peptidase [Gluconacetobacter diazotrophicus]
MGANAAVLRIGGADPGRVLWQAPKSISGPGRGLGISCGAGRAAAVKQSFTAAPELQTADASGSTLSWTPLTRSNAGHTVPVTVRSITWRSDQYEVQGWLLSPAGAPTDTNGPKGPMITGVHGGPAAANQPRFLSDRGADLALLRAGYRVFLPNPRGSFGQGEAFTQGNVRDFGHGDLRDILAGIDAVEKVAPVDDNRLGITGYSYGGYMTMWTVTQTNRFKAAVAGAGVSDWLSYYGENGIDQWMIPYFGASVYDDPEIYAKSSPITFIKQVRTPTFEYVGDRDVECPLPQTQEFYHALRAFGVPTQFVVYPGQGHGMRDPADRADAEKRTIAWFDKYLRPGS